MGKRGSMAVLLACEAGAMAEWFAMARLRRHPAARRLAGGLG